MNIDYQYMMAKYLYTFIVENEGENPIFQMLLDKLEGDYEFKDIDGVGSIIEELLLCIYEYSAREYSLAEKYMQKNGFTIPPKVVSSKILKTITKVIKINKIETVTDYSIVLNFVEENYDVKNQSDYFP